MAVFRRLLVNSLLAGVTSTFLWFALTFWVYLETRSVLATAIVGAAFSLASAVLGMAFGTYVDRHRKRTVMMTATVISLCFYAIAAAIYVVIDDDDLLDRRHFGFWLLVTTILVGSVAGNLRGIALGTCVTLLVDEHQRDRANGLVGSVMGVSIAITSVFSGLAVGRLGMGWAVAIALVATLLAVVHLMTITFEEPTPANQDGAQEPKFVDVRGALDAIAATPGLMALIAFAAFNNLLGGVFMALMDAYGLSLVSVESWGFLFGVLSLGFIAGGLIVARYGLGPRPLRIVIAGNTAVWTVSSLFALRSSIVMLAVGMLLWILAVPIIEAAEQTVLQRSVPFESQGRVFGFAQTVENAASPITALLIGALAEELVIPFMTTGRGVDLIGGWFGVGPERGLALIFTIAGLVGVALSLAAWTSKSYRRLAAATATVDAPGSAPVSSVS